MGSASLNKFTSTLIGLSFVTALSGCGIYQSNGRKTFENRSGGQLKTNIGLSQIHPCWKQSADQPLWPIDKNLKFSVQRIENNQLLICAEEAS